MPWIDGLMEPVSGSYSAARSHLNEKVMAARGVASDSTTVAKMAETCSNKSMFYLGRSDCKGDHTSIVSLVTA